MNDTSLASVGR